MDRVLILDGSIHPDIYRPADRWKDLLGEVECQSVRPPSGERVPPLDGYTHLVVTGSEASITRHQPWYDVEAAAVREAVERGLSVLGSCFGHQLLALALSGERYVAVCEVPELGWRPIEITGRDELLEGLPGTFWSFVSHFDEVRDPPPPWKVLARSADCPVQVARYGDAPVWGIQAHPEIQPQEGRALLLGFIEKHPERADLLRSALETEPRDDGTIRSIVGHFLGRA